MVIKKKYFLKYFIVIGIILIMSVALALLLTNNKYNDDFNGLKNFGLYTLNDLNYFENDSNVIPIFNNPTDDNTNNVINDNGKTTTINNIDSNKDINKIENNMIIITDSNSNINNEPKITKPRGSGGGGGSNNSSNNNSNNNPINETINLKITNTTSSTLTLNWNLLSNTTQTQIYIGPEPAISETDSLPLEYLIATIDTNINEYTISNLSASTDIFVRIKITTITNTHSEFVHAKTLGGSKKTLDNLLREIYMISPNIIELTLENKNVIYNESNNTYANNLGESWQNSNWQIHRLNGNSINITNVYRRTIPVDLPDYSVGWGLPYSDTNLVLDHKIYLVLSEDIGSNEILFINNSNDLNFIFPFNDKYSVTPVIQLNQVGYNPRATMRYAYVSYWLGDGGALSLNNFPTNAKLIIQSDDPLSIINPTTNLPITTRISGIDDFEGTYVKEIDLSSLSESNDIYRIQIPGVGISYATQVNEASVFKTYYTVARGLFFNRWAGDLQSQYTNWPRPQDHGIVYNAENNDIINQFPSNQQLTTQRTLLGGYHDAGDFDIRFTHTVIPQLLMRAYEINPNLYSDNQLNIPESGNNIPDILDEALWGVKAWEQLQESDGGVRAGVESTSHPKSWFFANDDQLNYFTFSRNANVSARVSGVFAQASRLLNNYDSTKSLELKNEAIKAYNYAKQNNAQNNFLLYGASELYKLTNDNTYKTDFENYWNSMGPNGAFSKMSKRQLTSLSSYLNGEEAMPDYILGYYSANNTNANIIDAINNQLVSYANEMSNDIINSNQAHRNIVWGPIDWGNGINMARFMDTIYAALQLDKESNYTLLNDVTRQKYFNALSLANDFMLGGNPNGFVYITGLGTKHVENPLHLDSLSFMKTDIGKPMPGIPVYGPGFMSDVDYTKPAKNSFYPNVDNTPEPLQYGDVRSIVTNNEFDVWSMQAPLVEFFAIMIKDNMTPNDLPSNCNLDCYDGN